MLAGTRERALVIPAYPVHSFSQPAHSTRLALGGQCPLPDPCVLPVTQTGFSHCLASSTHAAITEAFRMFAEEGESIMTFSLLNEDVKVILQVMD